MKNKEFQELIYLIQSLVNKAQIYYKNHEKEFVLIGSKIQNFLINIAEFTGNFLEHSLKQKIIASNMSKEGWFPSSLVFRTSINDGESNESFMRRVIKNHYEQIQETLYCGYPNRAEIFTEMFESLECGRYRYFMMECFAQIDGICTDSGYSPFFSKEYDKKNELKGNPVGDKSLKFEKFTVFLDEMIQSKKYDAIFLNYYKEIISFTKDCFIGQSTHKLDYTNQNFLLNRHGILHGDSTHLKAGTELNALKILSLLLFVDFLIRGVETYKIEVAKQSFIVGNDKNN